MMNQATKNTPSRWRRALRHCVVAAAGLSAGWSLAQTISDVPLVVKNNVPPNFMFMIDDSGSMSNIVPAAPYDKAVNYSPGGGCTALTNATQIELRVSSGVPLIRVGSTDYRHTTAGGTSSSRRCFTSTTIYLAKLLANAPISYLGAKYDGNFLNWYFGNAGGHPVDGWTDRKRVTSPGVVQTRLEIAKSSATTVIEKQLTASSTEPGSPPAGVRVGLSAYNSDNGGALKVGMADFTTTQQTAMKTAIANLTATNSTPLAETLADIGRYMATGYSGNVSAGPVTNVAINNFLRQDGRESCLSGGGANCETSVTDGNLTTVAGVTALRVQPGVGTPTRPIQYWCQRSYAFMMTDGRPQNDQAFSNNIYLRDYDGDCGGLNAANCAGGSDRKIAQTYESNGSDYLDDVAKALFDLDLRPNLVAPPPKPPQPGVPPPEPKKNNLRTYTIAFADADAINDPLLQRAADQGGGKRINAENQTELTDAFRQVISDAFANSAAAAAVAVANPQVAGGDGVGYASSYQAGEWYGDLVAYSVDTSTGLKTGANLWSLKTMIDAATINATAVASRKIVSFNGSEGQAFTAANFSALETSVGLVDFLRGDQSKEGNLTPAFRNRSSALGDIINAEPVVVNYPGGVPIIFQGANDGMLHVVDGRTASTVATRGQELWAYVPRLLHGSLKDLATQGYSHKYFVDATPATAQVTGVVNVSRLLVGGLGKGGRGFYALNISSYEAATVADAASKVLWEFGQGLPNMGYSFGKPLIVRTAAGWRVLVTSGYDNGAATGGNGGGYVWVLNPADGTVVGSPIATGVGTSANPSGLAHLSSMANVAPDALTRYVYGGDLLGNVWRFDLDTNTATKIAQASDSSGAMQPIASPPEVGPVRGSADKLFVYVGTGRYFSEVDVPGSATANAGATQQQTLYGYIDDTTQASPTLPNTRGSNGASCPTTGGDGALVCQSFAYVAASNTYDATKHSVDLATKGGWYVDWPADTRLTGGRMIGKPTLTRGGTLAVSVNVPKEERCLPGGSSWIFTVYALTGGAIPISVNPTTGTPGTDYYDGAGAFLSDALASRIVIITTADGTRGLVRLSDVTTQSRSINEPRSLPWRRIYWRSVK